MIHTSRFVKYLNLKKSFPDIYKSFPDIYKDFIDLAFVLIYTNNSVQTSNLTEHILNLSPTVHTVFFVNERIEGDSSGNAVLSESFCDRTLEFFRQSGAKT